MNTTMRIQAVPQGFHGEGAEAIESTPLQATSYLTPAALMAYCSVRLQGIDSQMKSMFDAQQKAVSDSSAISTLMGTLNDCSASGFDLQGNHAGIDLLAAAQRAIDNVGASTDTGQKLAALRDKMAQAIGGPALVTKVQTDPKFIETLSAAHAQDSVGDTALLSENGFTAGGAVQSSTVQAWVTEAKGVQTDLNNQSDLNMIQLQSLMSDRQTSVQMCTNLVQSLGDQANKIAANIGH